jgi:hypothetical protein
MALLDTEAFRVSTSRAQTKAERKRIVKNCQRRIARRLRERTSKRCGRRAAVRGAAERSAMTPEYGRSGRRRPRNEKTEVTMDDTQSTGYKTTGAPVVPESLRRLRSPRIARLNAEEYA